ncbi:HD family phosphohydrolase [Mycolicibacterium phlei]|uniref:HD family phosphohydrolase n=1 Tax=Mycolicibacterium TaxID=1866885 RepID=UPI0037C80C6F
MDAITDAEDVLRSLRGVWDEELVDELDHALQSAARARDDGADDELLLAAALHDLAHSPLFGSVASERHDAVARDWLTPRFGERVGWLAGAHVAAKRFLAVVDPEYAETLSEVSVLSLQHQGGPAVDPSFAEHPWRDDALRLRRYDDAAKDPHGGGMTVEEVLAVAARVVKG